MTVQQKANFFAWCNKYGIPLVCLVIVYLDFVRPQGKEHIDMVHETRQTQAKIVELVQENSNVQKQNALAQQQNMLTQQQIAESLKRFAGLLEEYHGQHGEMKTHVEGQE